MLERLRSRFAHGRLARRVAASAGWLVADRLLRSAIGFAVGVWVARHLGPHEFGRLSYALVLAGLLSMFVDLALESVVLREIARRPQARATILGTALGMRMIGAGLGVVAVGLAALLLRPDDPGVAVLSVAVAASFLTTPWYVAEFLYQSRFDARTPVLARFVGFAGSTLLRIGLILAGAPTLAFAWLPLVEGGLTAIALVRGLRSDELRVARWRFEAAEARRLMTGTLPLVLAGLATLAAGRVDQLLVGRLLGDEALGQFSAAARLTETANIVASALASALLPAVMVLKSDHPERFEREVGRILGVLFYAGLAVALPVALAARPLVALLYGAEYAAAGPVLAVHVWSSLFFFMGTVIGGVLVAEHLQRMALYRSLVGLAVVTALTLALVPAAGLVGVAWASVLGSAAMVYSLLLPGSTRALGWTALTAPFLLASRR